jgi:hypothetical protein
MLVLPCEPQRRHTSTVVEIGQTRWSVTGPAFSTQPSVPMKAFAGNIIIDRCGRIRWRQYGAETGLTSIRTAIEEALADPRYPNCPTCE